MKTVTVTKNNRGRYGWVGERITCSCIYAKYLGTTVYSYELNMAIRNTYPNDSIKQEKTHDIIDNFDSWIAKEEDLVGLRQLAKDLKMRVVVRKR